jgi:hypothetical protein
MSCNLNFCQIIVIDWIHDTSRYLGYPSDSRRTARKRAREAACGCELVLLSHHRRRFPSPPPPSPLPPLSGRARSRSLRAMGSTAAGPGPHVRPGSELVPPASGCRKVTVRDTAGRATRSTTLSHLAGVRRRPLAINHGPSAGLLVGVPDRRHATVVPEGGVQWGDARAGTDVGHGVDRQQRTSLAGRDCRRDTGRGRTRTLGRARGLVARSGHAYCHYMVTPIATGFARVASDRSA